MKRLSPHILWPSIIIALLTTSVVMMMGVVVLARSDGGAQVVENYYQKAANWDQQKNLTIQSRNLGWTPDCVLRPLAPSRSLLACSFFDASNQPLEGLEITATLFRPQFTEAVATLQLSEPAAGRYEADLLQHAAAGLWDIEITAQRDTLLYTNRIRIERTN